MTSHPVIDRRSALLGLGAWAALARPGFAQTRAGGDFGDAADRARALDQLHSLVIAHQGETRFAEAFRGPSLERPVNVKSVSKTVHATLTGAALDRGELANPDQSVADLLRDHIPEGADPRIRDITVDHLLTMRAGLERTSGRNYGAWVQSANWVAYALGRPFVAEPGRRMLYSTGSYHLLGAALTEASGQSLLTLARNRLGEPLGIEIPPWTRDPQGYYMGGNNMALSPMALLRFGEMIRQHGRWQGRQIISREWIETSLEPKTRSPFSGHDYGYGWFLARTADHQVAYARGYGGQMIYLVPDLELTVIVTSDPNRPARSRGYAGQLHRLLVDTIVPVVTSA